MTQASASKDDSSSLSRLLALPPTLLSAILWHVYQDQRLPIKDWLNLQVICSAFKREIRRLILVHDPLDDARLRPRHHDQQYWPTPWRVSAKVMPSAQYTAYLRDKAKVHSNDSRYPFARTLDRVAGTLMVRDGSFHASEQAKQTRYDEVLAQLCSGFASDPSILPWPDYVLQAQGDYPFAASATDVEPHVVIGAALIGLTEVVESSINLLPPVSRAASSNSPRGPRTGHNKAGIDVILIKRLPESDSDLLGAAARGGHAHLVSMLLARGYPVRYYAVNGYPCPEKTSTRSAAAFAGHLEVVELLSPLALVPNLASQEHEDCIIAATKGGHREVIELLMHCPGSEHLPPDIGSKIIWTAAEHGHVQLVQYGIDAGGDVNVREDDGSAHHALTLAASYGHVTVLRTLIAAGATVYPLLTKVQAAGRAASHGHVEALALLLDAGTPLDYGPGRCDCLIAAVMFGQTAVVDFLFGRGFDPAAVEPMWLQKPINLAVEKCYSSVLAQLARAGVDMSQARRYATGLKLYSTVAAIDEATK